MEQKKQVKKDLIVFDYEQFRQWIQKLTYNHTGGIVVNGSGDQGKLYSSEEVVSGGIGHYYPLEPVPFVMIRHDAKERLDKMEKISSDWHIVSNAIQNTGYDPITETDEVKNACEELDKVLY